MSKLIVDKPMPSRCLDCFTRLSCERYTQELEVVDNLEGLRAILPNDKCLIHGELVRCGECRRAIPFSVAGNRDAFCHCDLFDATMTRKDFCSYGERKEKTDE